MSFPAMSRRPAFRTIVERTLFALGGLCLGWYCYVTAQASAFQHLQDQALDTALTSAAAPERPTGLVGRLEIPRLEMSVMVMEGDDDATLENAAGHLTGTALPGEAGNVVFAGHRDTFFRPLRNLRQNDEIRLTSLQGTFTYRVVQLEVVGPDDVSVLAPTDHGMLTLVTCYPFWYVGAAPKRFIVRAELE